MADVNIRLSADEIAALARMVETALGETRVEVHRTHYQPAFRENVKQEEILLRGLLEKLKQSPAAIGSGI